MQPIELGGLHITEELEQVPFEAALTASDLYLDRKSIRGRNGYRTALVTPPGIPGDIAQGLWRHRGSPTSVRMVALLGGKIYISNDVHPEPSSETSSDMTMSLLGSPFGASANISWAQLHKHSYLGTDEANVAMRRIKFIDPDTYILESLENISQPAKPTATKGSLAWFPYRAKIGSGDATTTQSGCLPSTTVGGLLGDWYGVVGTAGDASQPDDGASIKVSLTTPIDIRGADWMAFGVTPPDDSSNQKSVQIELSNDNIAWVTVGTITDRQPIAGSPNLIFADTSGIADTIKQSLKYIRFTINSNTGGSTRRYAIYGHIVLYGRSKILPAHYFVDAFNPATLQQSPLSPEATLASGAQVSVSNDDVKNSNITYSDQYIGNDAFKSSGATLNPFDPSNQRIFNKYAGLSSPVIEQIGVPITVSGVMPSGYGGNLTARLWKIVEDGTREVIEQNALAAGAAYSLVDNGTLGVLSNLLYKASGTPPRMTAMCSKDGRVISVYENAVQLSSFVPLASASSDPFPQWPLVAQEDADGWSFTIDSGETREQCQTCVGGDHVYIGTNERMLYLSGTYPNAPYFELKGKGVISRRGCIWADSKLMWASSDGIYIYQGSKYGQVYEGQGVTELTAEIRDYYWRDFKPDNTTVIAYQQGSLYCWTGRRFIRFNFLTGKWTTGTTTDSPACSVRWYDVGSTKQIGEQLWFILTDNSINSRQIVRWQPDYCVRDINKATSDAGTPIPDWIYSTGFYIPPGNVILKWLYVDCDGEVEVSVQKTPVDSQWFSVRGLTSGETERAFPPNPKMHSMRLRLTAASTTSIKRLKYEAEPVEARGASGMGSR